MVISPNPFSASPEIGMPKATHRGYARTTGVGTKRQPKNVCLVTLSVAATAGLFIGPVANAAPMPTQTAAVQSLVNQTVTTQIVIPVVPQTSVVITPRIVANVALPKPETSIVPSTTPSIVPSVAASINPSTVPSVAASINPSIVPSVATSINPVEGGDVDEDGSAPGVQVTLGASTLDWKCPVPGAKFTNDWGQSRSGGRSHTGTDLLAPRGAPVFAPFAGTAVQKASSRGGLSVYLNATDGMQIFGAHLSSYGTAGKVKAGTIIGYVGNSGNASGAATHLHIEIHPKKGAKTNPFPVMKQICG